MGGRAQLPGTSRGPKARGSLKERLMTKRIFAWPKSRATSLRKSTQFITVHCSATPEGKRFDATDLDSWHLKQGWAGIGYHFVVQLDGSIDAGRPEGAVGSHVEGYNGSAIAAVYIGGADHDGNPEKTPPPHQKNTQQTTNTG